MRLLEYEAKDILQKSGFPIPHGAVIRSKKDMLDISTPVVLKSQIPVGKRGKNGGIIIVKNHDDLGGKITSLLNKTIRGFKPKEILAEELLDIDREFYLSLIINRNTAQIEILAHNEGGVEIEEQDSDDFYRRPITKKTTSSVAGEIADYFDINDLAFSFEDLLRRLYDCFITNECTLLEINPLILTKENQLVAGDAKIIIDDAALFRHSEWASNEKNVDHNFVELNHNGTVASIANGAGLAMATVDAITAKGFVPANFLDIGGTATPEKIYACFQKIMQLPNISTIVINIFGGIVRCDDVAKAIIEAKNEIPNLPSLAVRLTGTNEQEARELLADQDIHIYNNLHEILEAMS